MNADEYTRYSLRGYNDRPRYKGLAATQLFGEGGQKKTFNKTNEKQSWSGWHTDLNLWSVTESQCGRGFTRFFLGQGAPLRNSITEVFLQNTSYIRKGHVISGGEVGGVVHLLHPSPRSAPVIYTVSKKLYQLNLLATCWFLQCSNRTKFKCFRTFQDLLVPETSALQKSRAIFIILTWTLIISANYWLTPK